MFRKFRMRTNDSARLRRRRIREGVMVEALEVRRVPALFPFTVTIPQIWPINDPDPDSDPFFSDDGDYFAAVKIGDAETIVSSEKSTDEVLTTTNWVFTAMVDNQAGTTVQVDITLYDDDNFARFDNDKMDINPDPAKKGITLFVDLTTGMWTGDVPFGARETTGAGDNDKATIYFEIDSDSDGLNNRWEFYQGIEIDNDGSIDLPLPGANPNRRDLYVEVDAMAGRAPRSFNPIVGILLPGIAGGPIQIRSPDHGISTGDRIRISGVSTVIRDGMPVDVNGTWTVTRIDSNFFALDGLLDPSVFGSTVQQFALGNWIPADLPANVTPTGTVLDLVAASFGRAPVENPDGSTGISLHIQLDQTNLPLQPWTNDADGDGLNAVGEDVNGTGALEPAEDRNGNGVLDPSEDLNLNGVLDPLEDINGNGVLDAAEDLDGDGRIDPSEDINGNGILDDGDPDDQFGGLMFTRFKAANFGTVAEQAGGPGNPALVAKALAYRYGPFIDRFIVPIGTNAGVVISTSGWAYSATDFVVALGAWGTPGGTREQQAGTFMHELGHSIGIPHGGIDSVNNKPNYYSVMNYTWQNPDGNMPGSWRLDYSRAAMPDLDENNLNESAGIGGISGRQVLVGIGMPVSGVTTTQFVSQTGPIDWNGDGVTSDTGVRADANFDGFVGSVLKGNDDWAAIRLPFVPGTGVVGVDDDYRDHPPDLNYDQFLKLTRTLAVSLPEGNGADAVTLIVIGDRLSVVRDFDGAILASRPLSDTTNVQIQGVAGESDKLTVSFAGGNPIPSLCVWFEGGDAAGIDTLAYAGAPPVPPEYVPDGTGDSGSGQLNFGTSTIKFGGVEKVPGIAPRIVTSGLAPAVLDEGDETVLTIDFLDPGSLSSHRLLVDWGDGTTVTYTLPAGARSFSRAYLMADDIPSITASDFATIGYRLIDEDDLSDSDARTVLVRNVAPEFSNLAVTSEIDENGVVTLTGNIVDPGTEDSFLLVVDWGEGAPVSYAFAAGTTSFELTHRYLDDNPTGTGSDPYTISLSISDDDLGKDTASVATVVENVAPVLSNLVVTPEIDEAGTVTLSGEFADIGTRDSFTLEVDWGEGLPQSYFFAAGTTSFELTHTYPDDNPTATASDFYTIALILRDDDEGTDSAEVRTIVHNLAPVITAFSSNATALGDLREQDIVRITGEFTDIGIRDTHTAVVDWGDGSAPVVADMAQSGVFGAFTAGHAYASGGIFRIVVTLTDDDTGEATARSFAYVSGVGILDGQLQVVGTTADDEVTLALQGNGDFRVMADFLADSPRSLPSAGVTSVVMIMGGGDDRVRIASSIALPAYVDGGEGDDHLTGGNGPNLLHGGSGDDFLVGGSSHDILVGGIGADRIVGNSGDDILIAGTLAGEADPVDQLDRMLELILEWESFRLRSRIRHMLLVGGDEDADVLTGGAGKDWFFREPEEDTATDLRNEESESIG